MPAKQVVMLRIQRFGQLLHDSNMQVTIASSFLGRLIGLLAHRRLEETHGLLLVPCGSVHTIGMRFAIDVIFLDKAGRVLGWADNVPPNRFRFAPKHTQKVLEIAQGNRIRTGINLDDCLIFD